MVEKGAEKVFIEAYEAFDLVLQWIGSDEFNKQLANCDLKPGFQNGAVWGAAMATMIINTKATKYVTKASSEETQVESETETEEPHGG